MFTTNIYITEVNNFSQNNDNIAMEYCFFRAKKKFWSMNSPTISNP